MKRFHSIFPAVLLVLLFMGCDEKFSTQTDQDDSKFVERDNRIFIIDDTKKEWDTTHAVKKYGMRPENFQFGLGPDAIIPILNPTFLSPGDPNYPADSDNFLIFRYEYQQRC